MPWWALLLIKFAVQFGLPALEAKVGPQIAEIIRDLIKHVTAQPDQHAAVSHVREHLECIGVGCAPTLKY